MENLIQNHNNKSLNLHTLTDIPSDLLDVFRNTSNHSDAENEVVLNKPINNQSLRKLSEISNKEKNVKFDPNVNIYSNTNSSSNLDNSNNALSINKDIENDMKQISTTHNSKIKNKVPLLNNIPLKYDSAKTNGGSASPFSNINNNRKISQNSAQE